MAAEKYAASKSKASKSKASKSEAVATETIYPLLEARQKSGIQTAEQYKELKNGIYRDLLANQKTASSFLDKKAFEPYKDVYDNLIKALDSVKPNNNNISKTCSFDGSPNDQQIIKQLIQNILDARKFSTVAEGLQKLDSLQKGAKYVDKMNNIVSSITGEQISVITVATKDYENLKDKVKTIKSTEKIKEAMVKQYAGLLGNIGESIGIIQGAAILPKELKRQLYKAGIKVTVKNSGGDAVEGKRAVGDTSLEFSAKEGELLGRISISNKMKGDYASPKKKNIKFRDTTPNQVRDPAARKVLYNMISFHAEGSEKRLDLFNGMSDGVNRLKAFRSYIGAIIMKDNLYGSFDGDNVYYFNYGEYMFTINDLINSWVNNSGSSLLNATPYLDSISMERRKKLFQGISSEAEADRAISGLSISISAAIHIGNLLAAKGK